MSQEPDILSDDETGWMDRARSVASDSPDRSRKTAAVIVSPGGVLVAEACNTFPDGISETEARHLRPRKYKWIEHAERMALFTAAREGKATRGCTMFMPWYPCTDCARGIIQSGITEILAVEPDWDDPHYGEDFVEAREMLAEARVSVRFAEGVAPVPSWSP